MSEPRNEVIAPPPTGRARTLARIVAAVWALAMLLIPLRYYAPGHDEYDERFAWRMFSQVRVRECALVARDRRESGERVVSLSEVLPAPWISLLQRNRPAVIERYLAWRCETEEDVVASYVTLSCSDASGEALPMAAHLRVCESGVRADGSPDEVLEAIP